MLKSNLIKSTQELFKHSKTVVFFGGLKGKDPQTFIEQRLESLQQLFSSHGYNFVYVPELIKGGVYKEVIDYNRPSAINYDGLNQQLPYLFYKQLRTANRLKDDAGLLLLDNNYSFSGEKITYFDNDDYEGVINDFFHEDHDLRFFQTLDESTDFSVDCALSLKEELPEEQDKRSLLKSLLKLKLSGNEEFDDSEFCEEETPDLQFEPLPVEIQQKISRLKELGLLELLGDLIDQLVGEYHRLSRIVITKDYRILLTDYNKEIVMQPLPKSLYILFLLHPKGIRFKELSSYRQELLGIYQQITLRDCPQNVVASIDALVDPLNNSINEKCSLIRNAFVKEINERIASNYYIDGPRGDAKLVKLDRKLVVFEASK